MGKCIVSYRINGVIIVIRGANILNGKKVEPYTAFTVDATIAREVLCAKEQFMGAWGECNWPVASSRVCASKGPGSFDRAKVTPIGCKHVTNPKLKELGGNIDQWSCAWFNTKFCLEIEDCECDNGKNPGHCNEERNYHSGHTESGGVLAKEWWNTEGRTPKGSRWVSFSPHALKGLAAEAFGGQLIPNASKCCIQVIPPRTW